MMTTNETLSQGLQCCAHSSKRCVWQWQVSCIADHPFQIDVKERVGAIAEHVAIGLEEDRVVSCSARIHTNIESYLAARISLGPKRAPGRLVTAPSQARPATTKGCFSAGGHFRNVCCDKKGKWSAMGVPLQACLRMRGIRETSPQVFDSLRLAAARLPSYWGASFAAAHNARRRRAVFAHL